MCGDLFSVEIIKAHLSLSNLGFDDFAACVDTDEALRALHGTTAGEQDAQPTRCCGIALVVNFIRSPATPGRLLGRSTLGNAAFQGTGYHWMYTDGLQSL